MRLLASALALSIAAAAEPGSRIHSKSSRELRRYNSSWPDGRFSRSWKPTAPPSPGTAAACWVPRLAPPPRGSGDLDSGVENFDQFDGRAPRRMKAQWGLRMDWMLPTGIRTGRRTIVTRIFGSLKPPGAYTQFRRRAPNRRHVRSFGCLRFDAEAVVDRPADPLLAAQVSLGGLD